MKSIFQTYLLAAAIAAIAAGCVFPNFIEEANAQIATSTNFRVRSVVDSGGSQGTSTNFNVRTSMGQPGTGVSSSTSFLLQGGFLNFYQTSTAATSTPGGGTPSPSPLPGGGGGGGGGFIFPPGEKLTPDVRRRILRSVDLNRDGRMDMIDLSILLYHYRETGPGAWWYDFNDSLEVDFPDVSIMMFYWTG